MIIAKIVRYLLARHCQIDKTGSKYFLHLRAPYHKHLVGIHASINALESMLTIDEQTADTGAIDSRQIIVAFDALAEKIRRLDDLPLPISTIQV